MSRSASGPAARINLRELRRHTIKLPLKKLGHAIEDWVANQSPMGNSSIIDAKAFEWVERLEKNSDVIRFSERPGKLQFLEVIGANGKDFERRHRPAQFDGRIDQALF